MSDLLSVIVPVYNVQHYLPGCLDSLLSQSYKNLEILVIDDGSTDGSSEVCDRYAALDGRVRVFHTENQGLSAARNLGLEHAAGQYYAFVDSDDYVEPDMYERLYRAIRSGGSDIAVCGHFVEGKGRALNTIMFEREAVYTAGQCMELFITSDRKSIGAMVWNKLFRSEVFEGIQFPAGHTYEDIWIFSKIINRCAKVQVIPDVLYHHRMNPSSITHNRTYKDFLDSFKSRRALVLDVKKQYPEVGVQADRYMLKTCVIHWYKLFLTDVDEETREHLQKKLRAKAIRMYRICKPADEPVFRRMALELMIRFPAAAKYIYFGRIRHNRWRGY